MLLRLECLSQPDALFFSVFNEATRSAQGLEQM